MGDRGTMEEDLAEGVEGMDVEAVLDDGEDLLVEDDFEGDLADDDDDDNDDDDDDEVLDDDFPQEEEEEEEKEDECLVKLEAHDDAAYAVAMFLKEGCLMCLTGGGDDLAHLTEVERSGSVRRRSTLKGHSDSVTCVGFSYDGSLCATGSYDGSARIWNSASGESVSALEGPADVEWLDFHPRGDVIVAGSQDGTIWLWQARTGECLRVFVGHDGPANCGFFSVDGNSVISGSADGTLRQWAPKKGICKEVFQMGAPVLQVAKGEDFLVAAALDGPHVKLIHLKAKKIVSTLNLPDDRLATCVSILAMSSWVAVGDDSGVLRVFDASKETALVRMEQLPKTPNSAIMALKSHKSEPRLTVAQADGHLKHIDARTGAILYEFTGHTDTILSIDFIDDTDTDFILSAGDDTQPRLFKASLISHDKTWTKHTTQKTTTTEE